MSDDKATAEAQQADDDGHYITVGATGMAASMAGISIQAGDHRWISAEAWYMIHRAAFMAVGKIYEIAGEEDLTADQYPCVYRYMGTVDGSSVAKCAEKLAEWSRINPGCVMKIVFHSPGLACRKTVIMVPQMEREDEVEWVKRIEKRIVGIFTGRFALTPTKIRRNWDPNEWWLDSNQRLDVGLVDETRGMMR